MLRAFFSHFKSYCETMKTVRPYELKHFLLHNDCLWSIWNKYQNFITIDKEEEIKMSPESFGIWF